MAKDRFFSCFWQKYDHFPWSLELTMIMSLPFQSKRNSGKRDTFGTREASPRHFLGQWWLWSFLNISVILIFISLGFFYFWSLETAYKYSGLLMDYASCLNLTTQVHSELGFDLLEWRIGTQKRAGSPKVETSWNEQEWSSGVGTCPRATVAASQWGRGHPGQSRCWTLQFLHFNKHGESTLIFYMTHFSWSESQILTQYCFIVA